MSIRCRGSGIGSPVRSNIAPGGMAASPGSGPATPAAGPGPAVRFGRSSPSSRRADADPSARLPAVLSSFGAGIDNPPGLSIGAPGAGVENPLRSIIGPGGRSGSIRLEHGLSGSKRAAALRYAPAGAGATQDEGRTWPDLVEGAGGGAPGTPSSRVAAQPRIEGRPAPVSAWKGPVLTRPPAPAGDGDGIDSEQPACLRKGHPGLGRRKNPLPQVIGEGSGAGGFAARVRFPPAARMFPLEAVARVSDG